MVTSGEGLGLGRQVIKRNLHIFSVYPRNNEHTQRPDLGFKIPHLKERELLGEIAESRVG